MLRWFKRDGDEKIPSKKQDQLARYLEICYREDLPPPDIPLAFRQNQDDPPPLPLQQAAPQIDLELDDDVDEQELARLLVGGFHCQAMNHVTTLAALEAV
jgi:hypothetical protein